MNEKIICAAIWYKEQPTAHLLPTNVDKGVVICGHRHPHCIYTMYALLGSRMCEQGPNSQGFLTNKNRFVDREEAMIIALRENQIIDMDNIHGKDLYSEYIY